MIAGRPFARTLSSRVSRRLVLALPLALMLAAVPAAAGAQETGARVYAPGEVDSLPVLLNAQVFMQALGALYPQVAPGDAFTGRVEVVLTVSEAGVPRDAVLVAPGDSAFDAATLLAVQVLRFRPGMVGTRTVPVRVSVPVRWAYRDEAPDEAHPAGDDAGTVYGPDEVDEPARVLDRAGFSQSLMRLYPALLRDAGVEGSVTVSLVVGTDGRAHLPRVVRSTAAAFDDATLRAVSRLRFTPARRGGQPVAVRIEFPVEWSLAFRGP